MHRREGLRKSGISYIRGDCMMQAFIAYVSSDISLLSSPRNWRDSELPPLRKLHES